MFTKQEIIELSESKKDYLVKTKDYLHANPELSGKEHETSKFLRAEIKPYDLEIIGASNTGFIAIMDTGKDGPTIGLRTDIDALPIKESPTNLRQARKVVSKNEGVMHACAHDGHMSILLAAIKILHENKARLKGRIIFIFEEAEETGGGIASMIDTLKHHKIDYIYGIHLYSNLEVGEVSVAEGPVMAGISLVDLKIKGQAGHGSRPDLAKSPIFAAANIVNSLSMLWVNTFPTEVVTLGLASIHGGSASNIIPGEVEITGTLRFFNKQAGEKATKLVKEIAQHVASLHGCEVDHDNTAVVGNATINDSNLAKQMQVALKDLIDKKKLRTDVVWYASESFSWYRNICPSLFAFVGIKNDECGAGAEHHNELFDMDERGLEIGLQTHLSFVNLFCVD